MLNGIMQSIAILIFAMLSVITLRVIILNDIMLCVIIIYCYYA